MSAAPAKPYIVRHGDTLYRVTTASARDAQAEVLAFIDDPKVWRGELEVWNEGYYAKHYGAPDDVVDVEPAGAFPRGYSAADADSDRRDFEAGDDLTWSEVPAVEDAPPWDGAHDGGRLPVAGDFREPRR